MGKLFFKIFLHFANKYGYVSNEEYLRVKEMSIDLKRRLSNYERLANCKGNPPHPVISINGMPIYGILESDVVFYEHNTISLSICVDDKIRRYLQKYLASNKRFEKIEHYYPKYD